MYTLGQLNDSARLFAYGEKALAANPNSMPTMLLAGERLRGRRPSGRLGEGRHLFAESDCTGQGRRARCRSVPQALCGRRAFELWGGPMSGRIKFAAAVPELKTAAAMLKGQDEGSYATALYRLGYAYGKTNKVADARAVLEEAVKIPGPLQGAISRFAGYGKRVRYCEAEIVDE